MLGLRFLLISFSDSFMTFATSSLVRTCLLGLMSVIFASQVRASAGAVVAAVTPRCA